MYVVLVVVCLFVLAVYASAYIGSGVYLRTLCRVRTNKRMIALTFDDGPDLVHTPKVLDVLSAYGVSALFFCVGNKAELYPDIVKRMVDEGHVLGNHSYSHSNGFPVLGRKHMRSDLKYCTDILERISGKRITFFRPPFGVINPTIGSLVREFGFQTIGWSIRSLDTMSCSRARILSRVMKRVHPGAIVLLHDNQEYSEQLVEQLIVGIRASGYEIVSLERLINEAV